MLRAAVLACFIVVALTGPAAPADPAQHPSIGILPAKTQSVRDYLSGRALLHTVRAIFDVEAVEDIQALVTADAGAVASGVTEEQSRDLQVDLITEGGYFLTSLRYLIEAGFPSWPEDRSSSTYERDARMMLENLPEELVTSVLEGEDPISVFTTAARVYWWTEGSNAPLDKRADFSDRDTLVDTALTQRAPERASL